MEPKSYIAVDIETTGLSPVKDRIIEIGAVKVMEGKIVEIFNELVDPQIELNDRIIGLTGITDKMLCGKRKISSVIKDFIAFSEELPLLGHNILFDYSFLKIAAAKETMDFSRCGYDTLLLGRSLHSELESKSLEAMCQHYGIKNEQQHRAYHDAVATHELFQKLIKHKEGTTQMFLPKPLFYRIPKIEPMTVKQKNYLMNLLKYHKIETRQSIETLTKSEASRMIDKIILKYGRM